MREFHTKPKPPKEPIPFSLDDREMEFTPPGWAPIVLMKPSQPVDVTRVYLDWLGAGMSDEDGQYILDRLLDPNDEFDLPDITQVILGLIQEATGRPTEPPTDSSEPPVLTDSTDGRHQKESTPASLTSVG
jgi:hypothetical protein